MSEIKTHIDLFSGIGGFALAARWAGIKTVQFVEIDKFCQQVLQKNFPGVPIHDDIKTFANANSSRYIYGKPSKQSTKGHKLPQRESITSINPPFLLTGGFPCQPFSCAGKRRGKEDDRYLWEEMLRVIETLKPTWIIGENVAGINSMEFTDSIPDVEGETDSQEDGKTDYTNVLDGICDSLEAIGYEVQPVIIPACAVNAPHRRDRVWIVAHSNTASNGRNGSGTLERGRQNQDMQIGQDKENKQGRERREFINSAADCHVADTVNKGRIRRSGGSNTDINGIQEGEQTGSESRSTITRCNENVTDTTSERLSRPMGNGEMGGTRLTFNDKEKHKRPTSGWQENWLEAATRLCRVDDGVSEELYKLETSDRVGRLKALGNAIVPGVAYEIMKAIIKSN